VALLARQPVTDDPQVFGPRSFPGRFWARLRRRLDALPLRTYAQREPGFFSPAWLPDQIGAQIAAWKPDLVHVHWINNGFVSIETLGRIRVPQIWTLHDSWTFTGGCHYRDCSRFIQSCGVCPALGSHREDDLSRRIHQRKQRAWSQISPLLIAPSRWMADRAKASSLCSGWQVEVIPNPIDRSVYTPVDRQAVRRKLNLPLDRRLVLFSALFAGDQNKGLDLLLPALRRLAVSVPDATLVTIGNPPSAGYGDAGMPVVALGPQVAESTVAAITGSVDAVAIPSRSENFPFAVLEAQACGSVPVAFRIGGIPDLIEHRQTGWLAAPFSSDELAEGLSWALSEHAPSSAQLAQVTERCAAQQVALRHVAAYERVLGNTKPLQPVRQ
jgi:glycosyltransferase involved in cell wall biosynthesis